MGVASPMGTSHTTRRDSRGQAETRRLPKGPQERDVTGQWPGEVSGRTQDATNLETPGKQASSSKYSSAV